MPHETIRQILSILDGYYVDGDVHWVLRQMRDQVLIYIRYVSIRYPDMVTVEKIRLARAVTYEASRRHVESLNVAGSETQTFLFIGACTKEFEKLICFVTHHLCKAVMVSVLMEDQLATGAQVSCSSTKV